MKSAFGPRGPPEQVALRAGGIIQASRHYLAVLGVVYLLYASLSGTFGTDAHAQVNVVGTSTTTSVTSSTPNGSYKAGDTIAIDVAFSEAVTVTGTPRITLETGPTDAVVDYSSGSGTSTLTFNYTVLAGHASADLDYIATTALALNGGTIQDVADNAATLTLATPGAVNSLGANKAIVIDTTAGTVTNVTSSTTNGTYKAGDAVSIQISFTEAMTVTGTPQLMLETGVSDAVVNYASGSGTSTLTFTYTVGAGHNSSDLDYQSTSALALNDGTIKDLAGNAVTLTLPTVGGANSIAGNAAIIVDTTAPTVAHVTSSTPNGIYGSGTSIVIVVTFFEAVYVTGTPQLTLETGSSDAVVIYASGSASSTLVFTYTVSAGHNSADLDYVGTSALALNAGTIRDDALNNATLTLPSPGAAGSLGSNKALVIDSSPTATPTVTPTFTSTPTSVTTAQAYAHEAGEYSVYGEMLTDTPTVTPTQTQTSTQTPTATATPTHATTLTATPTIPPTFTASPSPTETLTAIPTLSPTPGSTAAPIGVPLPPIVAEPGTSDGGVVLDGRKFEMGGVGLANHTIELSVDSVVVGTIPTNSQGFWKFPLPPLSIGLRSVTAVTINSSGARSVPSTPVLLLVLSSSPLDFVGAGDTAVTTSRTSGDVVRYKTRRVSSERWITHEVAGRYAVPGDYDGDGVTDIAAVEQRGDKLIWNMKSSSSGKASSMHLGSAGDVILGGCKLLSSDRASAVTFHRRTRQLYVRDTHHSEQKTYSVSSVGRGDLIGCGDTDEDGIDEVIFKVHGKRGSDAIAAFNSKGRRVVFTDLTKFSRGLVMRRAGTEVPLVALVLGESRKGIPVRVESLAGSFLFPMFYVDRNSTIGTGFFSNSKGEQSAGLLWAQNDTRTIFRRLLKNKAQAEPLFKLPHGYKLTRVQNIYRTR
jgi:hypothetical protein